MKLAVLTTFLSHRGGGLFSVVRGLANALTENEDIELTVFGTADAGHSQDLDRWGALNVRAFDAIGPKSFGMSPRIIGALGAFKPDLIHLHGLWTFLSVVSVIVSRNLNIPRIVSPHGMLDPWAMDRSLIRKRIALATYEGANLGGAECIHALCNAEAEAVKNVGVNASICVLPSGVDVPDDWSGDRKASWRLKLPPQSRILLFLGRIQEKKGLARLFTAWARTSSRSNIGKDWHLVIAGWDEDNYQTKLEKLAHSLGINGSVTFVGPQLGQEKDRSFASADAFILPSLSEGLPVAALEAWSWSLPVIMTDECNLPEGFECGAAIRIRPTSGSIESGLDSLFQTNNVALKEMGRRGRALVEARFTWKVIAREFASMYRGLTVRSQRLQ
jgi:poly(glycerol-phosphate) alpha-glucosyltransferase